MKATTSIFNLIEIFTKAGRKVHTIFNAKEYCEHKQHHDFYCDTEKK